MRLLVAMEDGILVADDRGGRSDARLALDGRSTQSLAADPGDPRRLYCGTFDDGLWRSVDAGSTWDRAPGLDGLAVTAVAVSATERAKGCGVVYAGTEPSRIFRSEDGGGAWEESAGLAELPSASRWSFPPRPHTHHVRWIAPDPLASGRLYVAIEAGALLRTEDGGASWQDRVPGGPYDTHSLAAPAREPGHLHSAAGDGYFESIDGGATWSQPDHGLEHTYLWSVAVDSRGSALIVVSAASGPWTAHRASGAESYLYRRRGEGDWERLGRGLPDAAGTTVAALAADPARSGVVYAANNHGVYRSADAGDSWDRLAIDWPERFRAQRASAVLPLEGR